MDSYSAWDMARTWVEWMEVSSRAMFVMDFVVVGSARTFKGGHFSWLTCFWFLADGWAASALLAAVIFKLWTAGCWGYRAEL